MISNIRNFSIIAHIDHGKSTLADRMLELTGTVEKRKMREQVLDQMDLERERGITIKMQPVRMLYHPGGPECSKEREYVLNLIDTPGHIDFSYEVSRALSAVEGAILLVDATKGVQAQTLSVLEMAKSQGLVILPVINKIDLPHAELERGKDEIAHLLGCTRESILAVSGKTGEGVEKLLEEVVALFPSPESFGGQISKWGLDPLQALVFDFKYDTHRGIILFLRIFKGQIKRLDKLVFAFSKRSFRATEVGVLKPEELPTESLDSGEIGYVVTGIKEPGVARIGDTITLLTRPAPAFPGFGKPLPVVWANVYPENQDDFVLLRQALSKLSLSDSSLSFEEETSSALGRGFRCGLLGMLHLEIMTERLRREFDMDLIVASPTITYVIEDIMGKRSNIYSAAFFPDEGTYKKALEPWVNIRIITPSNYLGSLQPLFHEHEVVQKGIEVWGGEQQARPNSSFVGRVAIDAEMPLRELMRGFFDELKSVSSGYASLSYKIGDLREANISRIDLLVNDERVTAFSRVVARRRIEKEAEMAADKLELLIPRQLIEVKIQAKALGRIIASRRKSALRKDVTDYLYGGDITRKMKLREKQKKGKQKMQERGAVQIPHDVYLKMTKI